MVKEYIQYVYQYSLNCRESLRRILTAKVLIVLCDRVIMAPALCHFTKTATTEGFDLHFPLDISIMFAALDTFL